MAVPSFRQSTLALYRGYGGKVARPNVICFGRRRKDGGQRVEIITDRTWLPQLEATAHNAISVRICIPSKAPTAGPV